MTHSTPPSFFRCVLLALAALLLPLQAAFATRGVAFHHNRPATITEGGRVTTYGYDKAGRAVLMTAGNGQTTNNTYDALGRLTDRTLFQTPAMQETEVLVQLGWEHDAAGNVTAQHETWPGSPARPAGIRSTLMGYDDNYRLTSETLQTRADAQSQPVTQSTTTYTYNDANNRVTKTVTGGPSPGHWTYHSNEANQLETWTQHDAPSGTLNKSAELTYDANGNRETLAITEGATTSTTTYSWDALDRLTAVEMPDGTTHTYAYDHRTRRHGITRSGGSLPPHQTLLTFTGGLSAAEWEAENATPDLNTTPTVEYQRGPDMGGGVGGMLYSKRGSTLKYSLSNGRGDIIAQSDAAATITWTASYEAGGKRPVETGTNPDKQRGNSKDEDPTGLLNENLRYRELETMAWLSRDPAGFVDGLNLYSYVRQNPWSKFDPLGLAEENPERLPSRNYGFFEGEPGNSRFVFDQKLQPELANKYPDGVDFKNGRPDFSPMKPGSVSAKGVKLQTEYEIKLTGDTGADTAQARSQMIKQVREELKVSYKEADKIVRESLKDFRLHHHLETNKIIIVPQDVHAMGHYGERAASASRMGKLKGGAGKALAGFGLLQYLDPGQALAGPLGASTMGDATVSGSIESNLPRNDTSPGERLKFLQFSREYLGGDKAASDNFIWNSAGYEQELQHRESLQPK